MAEAREVIEKSFAVQVSAPVNFLEAIRRKSPGTRFFYASSCRVFGIPKTVPQDETTPFDPDCAYGISKAAGMRCVRYYRQTHGLFAVSSILYNHESPLRQPKFVSQKIVQGAVAIRAGRQSKLTLGDLDATADWGYAPDFVDAMIRMLGMREAEDFVIATGQSHTVRESWKSRSDCWSSTGGSMSRLRPRCFRGGREFSWATPAGWRPPPAGSRRSRSPR